MRGWCNYMEDYYTIEMDYLEDPNSCFLAVFDGHGGSKVANFSAANLFQVFPKENEFQRGDIPAALKKSFLDTDAKMLSDEAMRDDTSSATAVAVFLKGNRVYCANAGDSRAILCEKGSVFELSHDHKPTNPMEYQRIVKAGGRVVYKRVTCGNKYLAISRGLGDFEFKRNRVLNPEDQIVTADPEIIYKEIGEDDEFIVLASDGIWDCMTNEQVLEYLRLRLAKGILPHIICENIMKDCMAPKFKRNVVGCDNMSVIITCLLKGKSFDEFSANIKKSLSKQKESLIRPSVSSEQIKLTKIPIELHSDAESPLQKRVRCESEAGLFPSKRTIKKTCWKTIRFRRL